MQLFQLKNYKVIFEPITMTLEPFARVRDANPGDDDMTLKEMSFIWFFTDLRSEFQNILDEQDRKEEIKRGINLPDDWEPSEIVKDAIKYYREHTRTPSSGLYEASMVTAQYIENELKNPKEVLDLKDAKGNYMYKMTDLTRMLKDIPDLMDKLDKARKQIIKEIEEQGQLKGSKTKALFEDGI